MSSKKRASGTSLSTKSGSKSFWKPFGDMFAYVHNNVISLNQSKAFAGLVIIVLNISSKFVTIKLSKTMESYLKYTFSRDILVFAMAWMGTRDIYIALIIMIIFSICVDYLFNEQSQLCCLPESFTNYHIDKIDNAEVSPDEIQKAEAVLKKAGKLPNTECETTPANAGQLQIQHT